MNFRESEAYLLSLGNEVETMKLGLENIRKLLAALGNPQKNYLKVQVAGTNGKGSVCAFLDSICLQAGIKTGIFTSPHLVSITERIRIAGVDIGEDELARLATLVREVSDSLVERGEIETVPTYFEQVTAIALAAFAEANVALAILETGLGGRYDAVTAANAEICAITRIDYDHQKQLGETIQEIAAEKAAVIHKGSKVVIGEQQSQAMNVILDRCRQFQIIPYVASKRYFREVDRSGSSGVAEFDIGPPTDLGVTPGLRGRHQIENAFVAAMAASSLANDFEFEISEDQIRTGIKNARHPGRLEWNGKLLLDGAHNVGGAKALAAYLDESVSQPVTMIFGSMRDKNVSQIADILWPKVEWIVLTQPDSSRSLTAAELLRFRPQSVDPEKIVITRSVREALQTAEEISRKDSVVLVTGSLYLVGEVKKVLNN